MKMMGCLEAARFDYGSDLQPILVAEDDDDHFLLLQLAMESAGITNSVIRKSNGLDALFYLEACAAGSELSGSLPALLILDVNMPLLSGLDLLELLRSNQYFARLPSVVLSGATEESIRYELWNWVRALFTKNLRISVHWFKFSMRSAFIGFREASGVDRCGLHPETNFSGAGTVQAKEAL